MTKDVLFFLFLKNLHILIESRCLRLIQSGKLGLSVGSSLRNEIPRARREGQGYLYGDGDI